MTRTAFQFIAMLAAALLGECIMCWLIHMPVSAYRVSWAAAFWAATGAAYLVPRAIAKALRTRILGSLVVISALAVARAQMAWHLGFLAPLPIILAPLPALLTFCVAAFLKPPPRGLLSLAVIFLLSSVVYCFGMWWALGFKTDFMLLHAAQLIPFMAAIGMLLAIDNLMNTGDNPTSHLEHIPNSADAV
jgi:hypothetical protein